MVATPSTFLLVVSMPMPRLGAQGSAHLTHRQNILGTLWGPSDLTQSFYRQHLFGPLASESLGLLVQTQIPGPSPH